MKEFSEVILETTQLSWRRCSAACSVCGGEGGPGCPYVQQLVHYAYKRVLTAFNNRGSFLDYFDQSAGVTDVASSDHVREEATGLVYDLQRFADHIKSSEFSSEVEFLARTQLNCWYSSLVGHQSGYLPGYRCPHFISN